MEDKNSVSSVAIALRDSEFHDLDFETKNKLLKQWVNSDNEMKSKGQTRPVWDGHGPLIDFLGKNVVAETDKGSQVGKVIYTTIVADRDGVYKQALIIHIPGSGSIIELPGRYVRLAVEDDVNRMKDEIKFARIIKSSDVQISDTTEKKRRQKVKGVHLLKPMMEMLDASKLVVEDKTAFLKVFGNVKKRCVYFQKKGGRVDLSGFEIDHVAVNKISREEAKARHIGNVMAQIEFELDDESVLDAWKKVLESL